MRNYSDENKQVDYIDGKLEQFSRLEFAFQLLSDIIYLQIVLLETAKMQNY